MQARVDIRLSLLEPSPYCGTIVPRYQNELNWRNVGGRGINDPGDFIDSEKTWILR